MLRKGKMHLNENTMWPEKIAAIYEQFPWLGLIKPKNEIDKAFVKRIDENLLDLCTKAHIDDEGYSTFILERSILSVTDTGEYFILGQRRMIITRFFFLKEHTIGYFPQSVREWITSMPKDAKRTTHVVLLDHGFQHREGEDKLTRLTVFKFAKSYQGTLWDWYADRLINIRDAINSAVENPT